MSSTFPLPWTECFVQDLISGGFSLGQAWSRMEAKILDSGPRAGELSLDVDAYAGTSRTGGTASTYYLMEVYLQFTQPERFWANASSISANSGMGQVYMVDETRSELLFSVYNPNGYAGETVLNPGNYRIGMTGNLAVTGPASTRIDQTITFGSQPVPEPASLAAVSLALCGWARRRRKA